MPRLIPMFDPMPLRMWATRENLASPGSPAGEFRGAGPQQVKRVRQRLCLCLRQIPQGGNGCKALQPGAAEGSSRPGNRWDRADVHALGVPSQLGRRIAQPRKATTALRTESKDRLAVSAIGDGAEPRQPAHRWVGGTLHVLTSEKPRPDYPVSA